MICLLKYLNLTIYLFSILLQYRSQNISLCTVDGTGNGIYRIHLADKVLCVAIKNGSDRILAKITAEACNNKNSQRWKFMNQSGGTVSIRSVHSNLVLDVSENLHENFTPIIQYTFHNGSNQKFIIQQFGNGCRLIAMHSRKCLEQKQGKSTNSLDLYQNTCNGGKPYQGFTFEKVK